MPDLAVPGQPQGSGPGVPADEGWDWDGDDWDPAQSLTAEEIAALVALDSEGDPADNWGEDSGDAALVEVAAWLADPQARLRDDAPYSPPRAGLAEALPGLMPRRLGNGGGFDAGGVADQVPPGPVLAGLTADKWAAGLSRINDDELAGLMIAWRRVASWAAAGELAAIAELCRRRQAQVASGADPHLAEHVSDEVAMALTLTSWAAGTLVDRAEGLARLPKTMAALAAGEIDVPKALVILGELSGLSDVHAARVEAVVIGRAAGWTTGELRRAARHQVFAADPAAARRRKDRAAKAARVERWAEDAGTAALAGRDLPPTEVLAADAHLTAWAKRLKAAGLDGSLDELRAQVYLALLNGQPPETLLPSPAAADEPAGPSSSGERLPLSVRGSVNLVLPLLTWLGWSASPGEVAGFGPLDAADSRAVAAALARDPATKWCVTVTGPDGRAAAHGCAKAGPGQPPPEPGTPASGPRRPPPEPSTPASGPRQPPAEPSSLAGGPRQPPSEPAAPSEGRGPPPHRRFVRGSPASPWHGWRQMGAATGGSRRGTGPRRHLPT